MVITNNDITTKNYKKLSIQVSLSGLSFCVIDTITSKIHTYQELVFDTNLIIDEAIYKTFLEYPILKNKYDEVLVLHHNNLNTFVPKSLFDSESAASYLQYTNKVFENDDFVVDEILKFDMVNVHVPFTNINNLLLDQFATFNYKNSNSILVKKLLELSIGSVEKQIFAHVTATNFELVVVRNQELLFYNSFEYHTANDFVYYLLFTFEQLQLNPDTVLLQLLGNSTISDQTYKLAYKYIRNIEFLKTSNWVTSLDKTEEEIRNHFILFHS